MIPILVLIFLITLFFHNSKQAETDCVQKGGKNGKECQGKKTFVNMQEWSFIYEEDQAYVCCFYKGKIGSEDYEGCFPFYEDYVLNNKINNLLDDMEKGNWELAINEPFNEPSIDCSDKIISLDLMNKIFFFFFILLVI